MEASFGIFPPFVVGFGVVIVIVVDVSSRTDPDDDVVDVTSF